MFAPLQLNKGNFLRFAGSSSSPFAVSPLAYGAAGDGVTNDLAAMKLALESGRIVDGGGLTYGISGTLRPTSIVGLRNCTLKQLAPTTTDCRTLFINDLSNWTVQNVKIDCGGDFDAGDFGNHAGLWVGGATSVNWKVIDVEVFNGGPITGIRLNAVTNGQVINPVVRDFTYNISPDPSDDVINGIFLNACTDVAVIGARVQNLTGFLLSVASLRFTRGITIAGGTRIAIVAPTVNNVDQGVDLTGSATNTQIAVSDVNIGATGTYGVKFSNFHQQCSIVGGIISDAGLAGVVVTGQSAATPLTLDCAISNLIIKNTGSSGLWVASSPTGVQIFMASGDNTYPRNVVIDNVGVVDMAGSPTTVFAFRSDAGPLNNILGLNCWARNTTNFQSGFNTVALLPTVGNRGRIYYASNAGTKGSHWYDDGTIWKPVNGEARLATLDTPSGNITNSGETIVFQYQMPAALLKVGTRIRLAFTIIKSGTTDTGVLAVRLGTAGTTADTLINSGWTANVPAAASRTISILVDWRVESATTTLQLGSNNSSSNLAGYSNTAASAQSAAVAISNISNSLFFSVGISSSGAANTVAMSDAQLTLMASAN